mgnify:CR=1 FL=1
MTETVKTIKRLAERQGLSQANIARRMKTTEVSVSRWFNGSRNPSIVNVEKLAEAVGFRVMILK